MAKRKVTMYSTKLNSLKEIETDAQFFGQLRNELNLNPDNERIMIRENKVTLEHDEAELPEGDFYLFVSAKKQKYGAYIAAKNYNDTPYNDLRKYAKEVLGKAPASKAEIVQALLEHERNSNPLPKAKVKAETKANQAKIVEEVKNQGYVFPAHIEAKLDKLLRNQVLISKGLNILLDIEGESPIDLDSENLVEDLPLEEKNAEMMSQEEKEDLERKNAEEARRREEEEKKKALAREAASLGM